MLFITVTVSFNTTMVRDDESAGSLTFIIVTNRAADAPFTVQVCTEDIDDTGSGSGLPLGMATGKINALIIISYRYLNSLKYVPAVAKPFRAVCPVADVDYESGTFDVTFDAGSTSAEISINVTDDSLHEKSEAFGLVLKSTGSLPDLVEIVNPIRATGIIDDNDGLGSRLHCIVNTMIDVVK